MGAKAKAVRDLLATKDSLSTQHKQVLLAAEKLEREITEKQTLVELKMEEEESIRASIESAKEQSQTLLDQNKEKELFTPSTFPALVYLVPLSHFFHVFVCHGVSLVMASKLSDVLSSLLSTDFSYLRETGSLFRSFDCFVGQSNGELRERTLQLNLLFSTFPASNTGQCLSQRFYENDA